MEPSLEYQVDRVNVSLRYATISLTTFPFTSVRRMSRPAYDTSVSRDRGRAGAGSSRASRGCAPCPRRPRSRIVGLAVGEPALDAAAGHPDGVAACVVVAAVALRVGVRPNSPPQMTSVSFSRPRCFRSAADPAIGLSMARAAVGERFLQVAVMVPAAERDLDEAHARFDEPAGQQALPAEAAGPPPRRRSRRRATAAAARRCRTASASRPIPG